MSEEEVKECLAEILKNSNTSIRLTRELTKAVVTASTQIVGVGEVVHASVREIRQIGERFDGVVELAGEDSKKTGGGQIEVANKQVELLQIQIRNALADSAAKTRTQVKDYLQIFLSIAAVIVIILGLIKVYVHTP